MSCCFSQDDEWRSKVHPLSFLAIEAVAGEFHRATGPHFCRLLEISSGSSPMSFIKHLMWGSGRRRLRPEESVNGDSDALRSTRPLSYNSWRVGTRVVLPCSSARGWTGHLTGTCKCDFWVLLTFVYNPMLSARVCKYMKLIESICHWNICILLWFCVRPL